jgi:threonine dehydrogenase-like Zn-dependent dehydrogenase
MPHPRRTTAASQWVAGDAPMQSLTWALEALAKAGTLAIIGVYPPGDNLFPIGMAMNKNVTVRMGNCNHRKYVPMLVELVRSGAVDPTAILTQREPLTSALDAYEAFDSRQPGWIKVDLEPRAAAGGRA